VHAYVACACVQVQESLCLYASVVCASEYLVINTFAFASREYSVQAIIDKKDVVCRQKKM